jgi:hypothetical protein
MPFENGALLPWLACGGEATNYNTMLRRGIKRSTLPHILKQARLDVDDFLRLA